MAQGAGAGGTLPYLGIWGESCQRVTPQFPKKQKTLQVMVCVNVSPLLCLISRSGHNVVNVTAAFGTELVTQSLSTEWWRLCLGLLSVRFVPQGSSSPSPRAEWGAAPTNHSRQRQPHPWNLTNQPPNTFRKLLHLSASVNASSGKWEGHVRGWQRNFEGNGMASRTQVPTDTEWTKGRFLCMFKGAGDLHSTVRSATMGPPLPYPPTRWYPDLDTPRGLCKLVCSSTGIWCAPEAEGWSLFARPCPENKHHHVHRLVARHPSPPSFVYFALSSLSSALLRCFASSFESWRTVSSIRGSVGRRANSGLGRTSRSAGDLEQ
ncbi:hypothetical protein QBC39DRAFT_3437 [Podospora conica]|nr:hypothetical protein QBC39DRAFT_3437 [Schizothecium conicum]